MKIKAQLVGLLLLSMALNAFAVPITGSIGMGGNFIAVDSSWAATGTAAATGIDFDPNLFLVNSTSGSFTSVTSGIGNIQDFQFDPLVASIANFWAIDGFAFELTTVARGFTNDPNTFLVLEGTGIISGNGFDATLGTWTFTGDTTNGGTFAWSAGTVATAVPEPDLLVLLGIGLVGFAGRKLLLK